ncbi:MAG: HrcA family transcriptional regulator, partial [Gammaproteobacteria bacterium]
LLHIGSLGDSDVQRIARELDGGENVQMLMERTSSMLSEITRLAGIVMLPRASPQALRHIEFISLADNRVLVIMVANDREIQNRIIHTARPYKPSELQQAANYLNSMYGGKDLQTVHTEILRELKKMKDDVAALMQAAIEIAQRAFDASAGTSGDYVLSGQTNLMDVAELCDMEKLKRLFDSFNRKRDLLHLLEQAVNAEGVQIFIGDESGYEVLDNCSIVTSPYEVDGRILGVLGVIGPTRMDYERVIPIVDITAKMLGSALNSLN